MFRFFFIFATHAIADECSRLCEEFSADRRGDGYDLCGNETSTCLPVESGSNFCSNLYFASTDQGERGLIFESDNSNPNESFFDSPVTCQAAREILFVPGNAWDAALRIFVSSAPMQRWLSRESPLWIWERLNLYNLTGSSEAYQDLRSLYPENFDPIRVFQAIEVFANRTNTRMSFASRIIRHLVCGYCVPSIFDDTDGAIRLGYRGPEVRSMVEVMRLNLDRYSPRYIDYQCPRCGSLHASLAPYQLNRTSEVVAFNVQEAVRVTIPNEFNITEIAPQFYNPSRYRLYAIVNRNGTTIRVNNDWFLIGEQGVLFPIASYSDPIILDGNTEYVFYQQIEY